MKLVSGLLIGAMALFSVVGANADDKDVQTRLGDTTLNARLMLADGQSLKDGVFLITHGTLAHNRMEIVEGLQTVLQDRGLNSLAINLSLGLDNRKSAMYDCATPHKHRNNDAIGEIGAWVEWLKAEGASKIFMVGHSRGGNQTAKYLTENTDPAIKGAILIAPGTWDADRTAAQFKRTHGAQLAGVLSKAKAAQASDTLKGVGVLYCAGADVTAESFISYYTHDPRNHTPNLMPKITAPLLVIAGSEDNVVEGLIPATEPLVVENLGLSVIDGAGHFFRDLFLEDIGDAISEWIEGL